jgi:acyl-CoA thioesterase
MAGFTDGPDDGEFPLKDILGFEYEEVPEGWGEAWLDVAEHHLNPNGVVHGSVPYALADTAMGRATMSVLDEGMYCATVELAVRFLRPVTGGRLRARVEVLHAGKRIVHLEGKVSVDSDERPVASVAGSFAVLGG